MEVCAPGTFEIEARCQVASSRGSAMQRDLRRFSLQFPSNPGTEESRTGIAVSRGCPKYVAQSDSAATSSSTSVEIGLGAFASSAVCGEARCVAS
jgi:hypothetical protein